MNNKLFALLPAAAVAALAFLPSTPTEAAAPETALAADEYAIDNSHSTVLFRCEHLGVGQAWGRFNQMSGKVAYDPADPTKSMIDITVDANSIDSNDEGRDKHLRNADFLSSKEFPEITFKSTRVAKKGDGLEVTGDLTLHGVTKSVTAEVSHMANGDDPWGNVRVGFEARFTVDRTDFGMTYMAGGGGLGDDVHMIVSLEGTRKK